MNILRNLLIIIVGLLFINIIAQNTVAQMVLGYTLLGIIAIPFIITQTKG